jgi:chemotaxis protein CheC
MLPDLTLDVLAELANMGAGHTATALSQMTGRPVSMDPPQAQALSLADVLSLLAPDESDVSAAILNVEGQLAGTAVLITAQVEDILGDMGFDTSMALDLMGELGNITAARMAMVMESVIQSPERATPPAVGAGPRAALIEAVLGVVGTSEPIYMTVSHLTIGEDIEAELIFFPDAPTVERLRAMAA